MKDVNLYWKEQIQIGSSLVGKPVSEIPMYLHEIHEKRQSQINDALSDLKSNPAEVANLVRGNAVWRFGSVSTGGFIRGDLTAHIDFGGSGKWSFSGTCWCGPQAIAGGGGGIWSTVPTEGQKMDFSFGAGSYGGGEIQVYWSINGTVVGQLVAAVGGVAISGGSGSGKWKKD
jgi:hypothetical protein